MQGDVGIDSCPTGYQSITDPSKCQTASQYLDLEYRGDKNTLEDKSVCNWCGGCGANGGGKTTRVDHTHEGQAIWICELIGKLIHVTEDYKCK